MTFIPGIGETGPLTGPLVIGYMLGSILVGVLAMQQCTLTWTVIVGVLFGLEVIFTIFTLINAWAAFGTGWGDVESLKVQHWSLVPIAPLSGIKSARRTDDFWKQVWLAGDAVCDILIAISTVTILVRAIKSSHFRNTDTTLRRLIRLSVETGLITASGATVELILWQAEKFLNYHYIFFLVLGKLYSNAMMAALNSRSQGRETSQGNMSTTISGVHTRANHLTLFADEYPESSNGTTISASVGYVGNLDVSRHSGVEMAIIADKDEYTENTDSKSKPGSDYV
ncbi:hypothetical protein CVT25_013006 [Psilocybe cyanescens]|uniref:DUF6534 domain-containing protein n=1 Tax=Psilocybe cyanescens TaxID=93625 RepID=A0A409XHL6_PSICY|nr:hypothetical protein CVT25_013006 [Psilocybe cyanescens]